ncbi:MAG: bifunctional precorrin-2 dehydrogenase/sirohydrochlorin ferrochelatase [Thermodesulfobacteriota bacterium]|nr:MAG: bifunctional precorrin-2 dehydrogenase/sirohydrochlorin ferrochelatase [Thermodesulfobacteriota bacterium]RLG13048.1 MAG: bifunctional precorrin-2 dehydrogenase/sirohydrochlorin ferrochelatase [Candidatus Pacearchaeota archaeon]
MKYYPVFLNLKNRLCIVIGGGKVAERKVKMLLEAGAKIKVISPELTKDLTKLADEKKIIWEKREYKKGDLEGAWLVITATNNKEVQIEVQQEAEEKRIFCNIVDVPELCSFIVPSVIKRGLLTIAISTSSASPAVSRRIRENLENLFGEEYVIYMNLMKNLREQILNNQNLSSQEKNEKLQRLAMAPIPKYIKYKDFNLLKTIIEKEGLTFPSDILDLLNTNIFSRES